MIQLIRSWWISSADTFNVALRRLAHRVLPVAIRRYIWQGIYALECQTTVWRMTKLRRRMFANPPHTSGVELFLGYTVRITDGPSFYMQYKDEFIQRIYHFEANRLDPLIIDGGSNMGISILYFKHVYPWAHVIGFEPDPTIFRILEENVTRNNLTNVTLINAGLSAQAGTVPFTSDGSAGGKIGEGHSSIKVRMERLSDYLSEPVDFLKLNIEGEELSVLQEAATSGKLCNVRQLVLEYHSWPNGEQQLGKLLNLLDRHGFRYLVHDFDAESCGTSKPPFHLTFQTTWFCLVYACRWENHL